MVEDKVPSEAAFFKKLKDKKGDEYEKVLCGSIRLCLCISNILVDIDNVNHPNIFVGKPNSEPQKHNNKMQQRSRY
jgi:hypothetical protein